MSLLLTNNSSLGSSDGMMPGFLVKEEGMEKLVIVAISLILLTESLDSVPETRDSFVYINDVVIVRVEFFFSNLGRKCIISEERFMLELPTSCALLATASPLVCYVAASRSSVMVKFVTVVQSVYYYCCLTVYLSIRWG